MYLSEIFLIIMLSMSIIESVRTNKNFVKRLTLERRSEMFLKNRALSANMGDYTDDDDLTGTEREMNREIMNPQHQQYAHVTESQYKKRKAAFE